MLYDITMLFTYYLHNLYHLQAVKMMFCKLSLNYMFKDNFGGKLNKFIGKSEKNGFCRPIEPAFYNSAVVPSPVYDTVVSSPINDIVSIISQLYY